jgi:hypothetical protein
VAGTSLSDRATDFKSRVTYSADNYGAFEEMRKHILRLSNGVEVQHSFIDSHGQIIDCVPVEQQISVRGTGARIATPPDLEMRFSDPPAGVTLVQPQLIAGGVDKFGNTFGCPLGTIPVRRITLEEMTRFGSLREYFRKPPRGRGRHPRLSPPEVDAQIHKYAHAYQDVPNLGGHSFLDIWDPSVGSQVFSLAQHWYAGGNPVQTAECGWQVFPQKYQTTKPVLFIYWTADGYSQTGSYNLDDAGFVQTNHQWILGGALDTISVDSGQQYELGITWRLVGGNWYLYINGSDSNSAVGYYPTSLYAAGQMATNATDVDYGGEVVNQTFWPPMGSGAFANTGNLHAAYHRDIYYFDLNAGQQQAVLTPVQTSANCYTLLPANSPDPWNVNFFFGGPGGNACS